MSIISPTMFRSKVKKGFRSETIGLPFPNFALGKTELPSICHCIFDGDKFYVTNDKDMHILHQNGAFGVSSLTNRGLSYNDPSFFLKPYFAKHLEERGLSLSPQQKLEHTNNRTSCIVKKSSFGTKKAKLELFDSNVPNGSPTTDLQDDCMIEDSNQINSYNNTTANGSPRNEYLPSSSLPEENPKDKDSFNASYHRQKLLDHISNNFEDERLILMPEEAIFLSFGVGCLTIHNPGGDMLGYKTVWKRLVETNPEFPISYAVYHYFRAKNWVPKLADTFGAAYVLYEVGPTMHHSSYIVQILGLPSRPIPTWHELHAWMRLASQANKSLVLCEVSLPLTFNAEISEPQSIFEMSLKETSIFRWVPHQDDQVIVKC